MQTSHQLHTLALMSVLTAVTLRFWHGFRFSTSVIAHIRRRLKKTHATCRSLLTTTKSSSTVPCTLAEKVCPACVLEDIVYASVYFA
jgi:hypothetical protein